MDLLGQEQYQNKEQNKGRKIVLNLIIISILLFLVIVGLTIYLYSRPKAKQYSLIIDENSIQITEGLIITDEEGKRYISLKDIANKIGQFSYYNGEYMKYSEEKDKCYLEKDNEIIGFEANSNIAYRTTQNSMIEYRYLKLSENIIYKDEKLYILIDDIRRSI